MKHIEEAIEAFRRGEFLIVVDDEDRENEGDLILAGQHATDANIGFMVRHTSGVICQPMSAERLHELHIEPMVALNEDPKQTAYTVSVDVKAGTTTGISSHDRALTIRALASSSSTASDFTRPGHIFPLRARSGGVLKRAGHTEAAVDLCRLAGLTESGVIAELVHDDGSMQRYPSLVEFGKRHGIRLITIADLIKHRRQTEKLVQCVGSSHIPTRHGDFLAHVYESTLDGIQHMALVMGDVKNKEDVLVRVHSECLTGDVFGSQRCDCGEQLDKAMAMIADAGRGVIIYLRGQEGRGIGLGHKLRAYALQDAGLDTVEANLALGLPVDSREYGVGAQILSDLGLSTLALITNNPSKYTGLSGYNIQITRRVPCELPARCENLRYLQTKQDKMGHLLHL